MQKGTTTTDTFSPPAQPDVAPVLPRNRMEIIRFETRENLVKAMGVFRQVASSDIHFTFRGDWSDEMCITNTATVRALQALGVKFNWRTSISTVPLGPNRWRCFPVRDDSIGSNFQSLPLLLVRD
jgi:hypothetical protein